MAFQSAPDCAQATIVGLINGVTTNTTLIFAHPTAQYLQADINSLAIAVDDWFGTELLPFLCSQFTYVQTEVRGLESLTDLQSIYNANTGVGGDSNNPLPALLAACISFRTGATGRSARGRNYIPGLSEANIGLNENQIETTTLNALAAAYADIPTYVNPYDWDHVVLSRYTANAARPTATYRTVTQYIFTDNLWDTQRRRK